MDENCEGGNANEENLLSQSYFDGIQKVTGNDRASLLDFQIPADVLEKRKSDWNALFEKYSSNVCEEQMEDEVTFSEQEKEEDCTTKNNQRAPMRKPMSMVQYWVDTGNPPYIINNLEKSQSDSGSSLEEEGIDTAESTNSPYQMVNASLEKNLEANGSSENMHLRLCSSSGSSVDTVAYVLANNNTTKKEDTIAIMEGSKIINKKLSHPLAAVNGLQNIIQSKKDVSFLDSMLHNLRSKKLGPNISKNISKSKETMNNVSKNLQNKSQNQEYCSIDSDESIYKSKYDFHILSQNSVEQNDDISNSSQTRIVENKTLKRKKLYNNTESATEFTPVSEENASHLTFRMPIKKCEHPALETPRVSSRPSYLVRYKKLKLKSKRKSRISHSLKMLQSLKNGENNSRIFLQDNSQKINRVEENYNQNLTKAVDCSNSIKMQNQYKRKSNSLSKNLLNDFKKKAFNIKPLVISLQRLPYKYDFVETRSLQEKHIDSLNLNSVKINCRKNSSQCLSSKTSHALESKIDSFKNFLSDASPNFSDKIDCKLSTIKPYGFLSQIQNNYSRKSISYVVAFSSDDDEETEISISNLRQKIRKVSKDTIKMKNSLDVNNCSEKEILSSNSKIDNTNTKSAITVLNKIKNENRKNDFKRINGKVTELVEPEKNRMTDGNYKSLLLENSNISNTKIFSSSKQMDKKFSLMSSDEESVIVEPTDCSVPNRFLEKSKGKCSPAKKALKEKFDQTAINMLCLNEKQKFSSNEKKSTSETKSLPLKKSKAVKNLGYSRNTSSSDEDLQLPMKYNFNCKPKIMSSVVKGNIAKLSSAAAESVTNLIGDLSQNAVLKESESKINHLEERINKLKMKNQSTLLNSDNNHLKTVMQTILQVDSPEEENSIENKSSAIEIVKKSLQNKNKRPFKEYSEISNGKSRNKKVKENSRKEYLSSKNPKRKSEILMSSDEECIIPLKIKLA